MILTRLDNITAYRMHTPKWAVQPTSGLGAAKRGGRVNRPGVEALYLSLDRETAIQEYQQLSELLPPGLLVSYQVTLAVVVDFRRGYTASEWDPLWDHFTVIGERCGSTGILLLPVGLLVIPSWPRVRVVYYFNQAY